MHLSFTLTHFMYCSLHDNHDAFIKNVRFYKMDSVKDTISICIVFYVSPHPDRQNTKKRTRTRRREYCKKAVVFLNLPSSAQLVLLL